MNKLPTETIADISSHLSFADKLNLACICNKIYKIISENTLYKKQVFNDELKLNQAMGLHERSKFGHQVRDLCIGNVKFTVQLVSALPMVFPGIRCLELKSGLDNEFGDRKGEVNPHIFKAVVNSWEMVESIVDCFHVMNVTMRLLELLPFDHLRSLEIDCIREGESRSTKQRHARTKALIEVIHNAPH